MPRPNPPPTPGSSSDIRGKEGSLASANFALPPTAFQDPDRASTSSATPSANGSDSSYRPASPTSPAGMPPKRSAPQSGPVITKDDFTLPPPPTRSRKIIQMKPRDSEQGDPQQQASSPTISPQTSKGRSQSTAQSGGGKRKSNNTGSTAAGRKIARKTAHSLIERRRRSKMNEEFGVLKDMIPACKGQEMHKLAILQASIDYLRYLEQCVSDLQTQNSSPRPFPPPSVRHGTQDDEGEEDEDEEMEDDNGEAAVNTAASTPVTAALDKSGSNVSLPSLSQITTTNTTSPSTFSSGAGGRHYSISSASQASYSPFFHSTQTSPAFGPQLSHASTFNGPSIGLGSPALRPNDYHHNSLRQIAEGANSELSSLTEKQQRRPSSSGPRRQENELLDHEASAALLMLNHDRRSWAAAQGQKGQEVSGGSATPATTTTRSGTGMSVRDLLSG